MAAPAPPQPAAAPRTPIGSSLRTAAAIRAQTFIGQHFRGSAGMQGLETEGVRLLKGICGNLEDPASIDRLFRTLRVEDGAEASTFEFLSSGAVTRLKDFLLGAKLVLMT